MVHMSAPLVQECLPVLERTPAVLQALLRGLPATWTSATEGPGTWSAFDVVGHLIHGEATIDVPADFRMVTSADGLTVVATPIGGLAMITLLAVVFSAVFAFN